MKLARALLPSGVRGKLSQLETAFAEELRSDVPLISKINQHITQQAGKRVRPTLLFLCADVAGYRGDGDVTLGVVTEIIHTATLIHDDIIDHASTRRGQRAVNAIWGTNVTVLLGDYLYVKSMELALRENSLRILEVLTATTMGMVEGELMELDAGYDLSLSQAGYLEIVRRKTAVLFGACGRLAGLLAHCDREREQALYDYGLNIGMAFQLVDDMLDFVGDERRVGKPVVSDLSEGKITLPVILLLERAPEAETASLRRVVEQRRASEDDRAELMELFERYGTLEATSQLAEDYCRKALKNLAVFDDSASRRVLEKVSDLLLARTF